MKLSTVQIIKNNAKKGFTLIELLVVIGILGILAAALVATIDPFEQLQKATDSRRQNMAVEFLNANIRYYTTQTEFTWDDDDNDTQDCYDNLVAGVGGLPLSDTSLVDCIGILAETGELKGSFATNTNDLDDNDTQDCYDNLVAGINGLALSDTSLVDCIGILAETGELKGSFATNTNDLDEVYVTWDPSDATDLVVCYAPVSKSQKGSPETIYDEPDGVTVAADGVCNSNAADGECFWCTR